MAVSVVACCGVRVLPLLLVLATITVGVHAQNLQFTNAQRTGNSFKYRVDINQNYIENQTVLQAVCTNTRDRTAAITYSLHGSNIFAIDQDTGTVTLKMDGLTLDDGGTYSVTIQCSSQLAGTNRQQHMSATLNVNFRVENDYPPVFSHQTRLNFTFCENHNISRDNNVIFDFDAMDEDRGVCGRIRYSIESLSAKGVFQIDSITGVLSFAGPLDYEKEDHYTIVVAAGPRKIHRSRCSSPVVDRAQATVDIFVTDVNDTPPQFESDIYDVIIEENSPPRVILRVTCSDPDTQSFLVYSIVDVDSHSEFLIDSEGNISLTTTLDYETNPSLNITVSCQDTESVSNQVDYAQIHIAVSPVNEHRPEIVPSSILLLIEDVTSPGTKLVSPVPDSNALETYRVVDEDRSLNHNQYNFSMAIYPDFEGYFSLNHMTGELSLQKKFECGQDWPRIVIAISVCDIADIDACNMLSVTIFVSVSDCIPYFRRKQTVVSVSESTLGGTNILSLPCRDVNNTNVTVTILPNNQDSEVLKFFSFNQQEGSIYLLRSLDYEHKETYTLQLSCKNSHDSVASAEVKVSVLPENDNSPLFDRSVYIINVTTPIQAMPAQIGQLQATDLDRAVGGNLTYSLVNPSQYFTLQPNGRILLSNTLPDSVSVFVLEARASDGDFSANTTIIVITQENTAASQTDEEGSVSMEDYMVLIAVFATVLFLMVLVMVLSWFILCRRLHRRAKRRCEMGGVLCNKVVTTNTQEQDCCHYEMPLASRRADCLAYNSTSLINDPAFNGCHGRAKQPLPKEPEYETLMCKPEPYSLPKQWKHKEVAPQHSVECYIAMQSVSSPLSPKHDNSEKEAEAVVSELTGTNHEVKLNDGKHESSLEFSGSVETSLEFGGTRGISLDFGGQDKSRMSPRVSGNIGVDEGGLELEHQAGEKRERCAPSGPDVETNKMAAEAIL